MSSDPGYIPNEWNISTEMNSFPTGIHSVNDKPMENLPDTLLTEASTTDYEAGEHGPAKIIGGSDLKSGKHEGFYFRAVERGDMPGAHIGDFESVLYADGYDFLEGERVVVETLPHYVHGEISDRDPLEELNDAHVGGKNLSDMR